MAVRKNCLMCGKEFEVNLFRLNKAKYCSYSCRNESYKGKSVSQATEFKKGHIINRNPEGYIDASTGYRRVTVMTNKRIPKSHKVWMENNGYFPIPKKCVVHHINGDKLDNTITNLLMVPRSWHMWIHRRIEEINNGY